MDSQKNRLTPVLNIARAREQSAAKDLAESRRICLQIQQQIKRLKDYRAEYRQSALIGMSHNSAGLADTQLFLSRLNKSIELSEQQLQKYEKQQQVFMQDWMKAHNYKQSLDRVVSRRQRRLEIQRSRLDQKANDEMAVRRVSAYPKPHYDKKD